MDIESGEHAVELIKEIAQSTFSQNILSKIGGFGGMYRVPVESYKEPVMVSTTDGVGTKAYIATMAGKFDTIGMDLVAMCADDLVCCGANPVYMLDYVAISKLHPLIVKDIVSGIAAGCKIADCSLVGGEMAEHPGSGDDFNFDLAGFAVGIVERDRIIDGNNVNLSDILVGLPSYNLRSNGFSLVRKIVFDVAKLNLDDRPLGRDFPTLQELLLEPSVIYAGNITKLLKSHWGSISGIAHITGGGMVNNLKRILPPGIKPLIDKTAWERPSVFDLIQRLGNVDESEMDLVFNNGIGMVLVVKENQVETVRSFLSGLNQDSYIIGGLSKS